MKKAIFIAVCIVGMFGFSSCRSTSQHCGLAKNDVQVKQINQQQEVVVADATVRK